MACQLYTQDDLTALYSVVYGEILDRIKDPSLGKFDQKAYDSLIKKIYNELKDNPDNALIYAQAVPDIFNLVANDPEINRYLVYDVDFNFNYPKRQSLEFENLEEVKKFVTAKKTVRKTKTQIDKEIKEKNKQRNNVVQKNDKNATVSALEENNKAKVDYPNKTTLEIAVAKNPKTMTQAEKDQVDGQKRLFSKVIKAAAWAAKTRDIEGTVLLEDTPIALTVQRLKDMDPADLTNADTKFLSGNREYELLVAVVSDEDGVPIRFDEDGNRSEDGRIVYQYIRPILKESGKLYLGNTSGYKYTLVPALDLAKRKITQMMDEGEILDEDEQKAVLADIKAKQKQLMNDLSRLHDRFKEDFTPVILPITGGSYGIVEKKSELLSKTPFADKVNMAFIHPAGENDGKTYFLADSEAAGVTVNARIYLQRMDVDEKIARSIAKVLTIDALKDGEPLLPQERLAYYQNFFSNESTNNNMTVKVETVLNQDVLTIDLYNPLTKEHYNPFDDPATAEDKIVEHLMTANKKTESLSYPASMSYMRSFSVDGIIQKGKTFEDYEFVNKAGKTVIKAVSRDYFTFIKPYMKVDYTIGDDINYFEGLNPYLEFAIPDEFATPEEELVAVGTIKKTDLNDKSVDNGETTKKKRTTAPKTAPKMEIFQSNLTQDKAVSANVNEAGVTFGIGTDFTTKDEKHAEFVAGKANKWYGLKLGDKKNAPKDFTPSDSTIDSIVKELSEVAKDGVVNVIGNHLSDLISKGYTQKDIDTYIYNILSKVNEKFPISKIIANGQTGVSEAAIKAAIKLNIPVKIRAFKGFSIRVPAKNKYGYNSISNTKEKFMSRFYGKNSPVLEDAEIGVEKPTEEKVSVPKAEPVVPQTPEEKKEVIKKISKTSLDDLLGDDTDLFAAPTRNKIKAAFMDQMFGNRKSWEEVEKWWKTSPLKNIVSLERLTAITNSDAYGRFLTSGALLAEVADKLRKEGYVAKIKLYGDALPVTLYHEAWHAFSQLVLTVQEKTDLYDKILTYDKYKDMSYIEIEEELAEGYIEYIAEGKKPEGFIQKIYDKIKALIDYFFGRSSNRDLTRLYEIPAVKEYYDKLYTGKFTVNVENATDNVMEGFQKLNSSKKIIQPLAKEAKDYLSFTDVESDKAVDIIDSLMARQFYLYNTRFNTTAGAVILLNNVNNREKLYNSVEKQLQNLLVSQIEKLEEITMKNLNSDSPDVIGEQKAQSRVDLLVKMTENFGNIAKSISRKTKKGVVAFHMQRSRFNVLKEQYKEDLEDATTQLFSDKEGNSKSAKELASEDTMMMLSGIYKMQKDKEGNYIRETDEEGVSSFVPMTDEFGLPELETVDNMWSRLARTLQGAFDYKEMYDRIAKGIKSYAEFAQVLDMLPNPYLQAPGSYNTNIEFNTETGFWQDFKKPVIPYIQFNINKEVTSKAKFLDGKKVTDAVIKYESRVARANFDIYKILNDWGSNFTTGNRESNPYIIKEKDTNINFLDIQKLMDDVSNKKQLIPSKANDFLKALGIVLDTGSAEIKNIIENKNKPFIASYNIEQIYASMRLVYLASKHPEERLNKEAQKILQNPLQYLLNGSTIIEEAAGKKTDVSSKIRTLAELQNRYSDGYSNYSVLTPEKNRVWEQFMDNTITRIVTAINLAENWQELTTDAADPNGRFQHMRWLAEENNPASQFSIMLNSVFDLNLDSDTYGEKLPEAKLLLENIGGTQIIEQATGESIGVSTASTDVTSKFLQEVHTMLSSGVQEFMRHASKQTAMNMRAMELKTYPKKSAKNLYVDIMAFSPTQTTGNNNFGETQAFNILLGYIAAEGGRIFRYISNKAEFGNWAGYNRPVVRKDNGQTVDAGEAFTAFDDVISPKVQGKLYAIIDKAVKDKVSSENFNLKELINDNTTLRQEVKNDVIDYFAKQSKQNYNRLQDAKYIDQTLYDQVSADQLGKDAIDKMLIKAYTYNSWIHNFETVILAYGDMVQYNHDKEEFHKRNAGLGSGGRGFRADFRARAYINSPMFKKLWAEKEGYEVNPYDGTLNTAIIQEIVIPESKYAKEYRENHVADYTERYLKAGKSKKEAARLANELADKVLGDYEEMKIGDGQGWVTFEAYRMLKKLEDSWSQAQEDLYKRIVAGDTIKASEVTEYFPPYKLQHFGHIKTTGLGLVSFHKFSLAPIIPTVATDNTNLGQLHRMMMEQGIHYALMPTGSKVGHIGSGDVILDTDGNVDRTVTLTKNTIYVENLKNQTEINPAYKGKAIFSTQLRKLILEGLYEQGTIDSNDPMVTELVDNYINRVTAYTELLKQELLDEIGFAETEDGEYIPVDKDSVAKLAKLIRDNLTRDDVISDELIDVIDVTEAGDIRFDLSLHPEAAKIEKLLLSLINKRIIKQKVKGEPLVQVSSAMYDGLFKLDFAKDQTGRDKAVKKYMGSNFLPTYHKGEDGKTTAMKVAIAMQGDYESLLNLEYNGEVIGTVDKLNEAIKDDSWLDENDGANRKAITMVGVRIPVQGLNSMEFMEVYHFLPAEAGNIIIPPPEIVAKSGADFDIDKLTIFMNTIDGEGKIAEPLFDNLQEFFDSIKDADLLGYTKDQMYAMQKAGMENQLINDIRKILELPQNYVSLTTPNGTYLVKPIADKLSEFVMEYDPFRNMMIDETNMSAPDKNGKQKKVISPTRVLEAGYNLYKHESNVVGKRTLGLGAIENTFNVIFNSLGAYMPATYIHGDIDVFAPEKTDERVSFLGLRHNTMKREGQDVISLSNQYDVDNENKVADIISQLMNGWVDVEKDAWVFFVQGNYDVAPILLYLLKAGVPVKEAVYFVSQPLVREYIKEKNLAQSTFAEPLRKSGLSAPSTQAANNVIARNFPKFIEGAKARYQVGAKMYDKYFENKKVDYFTEKEMLDLIEKSATDPEEKQSFLSRTMFLHYLTIEQQIQGITELKMASNPDTSLMTDVGQALQGKEKWNKLVEQTKVPDSLKKAMRNDSILKSFFNYDLIEGLAKPIFKIRYDEVIQAKIDQILSDFESARGLKQVFGKDYRDKFSVTFRNDILSYLFQNAMKKYQLGQEYSSFILDQNVDLESASGLNYGVQFVNTPQGPKMLVDNIQIEREYSQKAYLKGSKAKNNYESRGLYPLSPAHFDSNSSASKAQYIRFVMEREYLRNIYPVSEISKTDQFKAEYQNAKQTKVKDTDAKNARYAYEKILAEKALDNVLNIHHLFSNKDTAYAVRLERIKTQYQNDFVKDYKVLSKLKLDSDRDRKHFNVYLDDKDIDTYKSNLYTSDLARLSDRNIKKVDDIAENNTISDYFAKMTFVAMMQAGTNKSKFNFLNITDFDKFLSIMNAEVAEFLTSPAKAKIVNNFTNVFFSQNSTDNFTKYRFKDYLTSFDVAEAEASKSETEETEGEENQSEKLIKRKNLLVTSNPNVFVYNDLAGTEKAYKYAVDNNPDVTFVYGFTIGQKQQFDKMTDAQMKKAKLTGQALLKKIAGNSSVGIVIGQDQASDNFSKTDPKYYDAIKKMIENQIQEIVQVVEAGNNVAFSIDGYGDVETMPKEIYDYLSRRLFEEFQYLNPGSGIVQEVAQEVAKYQPVTDAEILAKFEGENDVLMC